MRSVARSATLSVWLFLGFPGAALATSAWYVSEIEHAELSTAVVRGAVTEQVVRRDPATNRLYTYSTVRVAETLYGVAPADIVVRQFGGRVGDEVQAIAGDATLVPGEEVVLFVRNLEGTWFLTALEQSKYAVVPSLDGPLLERELGGGLFVRSKGGGLLPWLDEDPGRPMTLERLRLILRPAPTSDVPEVIVPEVVR